LRIGLKGKIDAEKFEEESSKKVTESKKIIRKHKSSGLNHP